MHIHYAYIILYGVPGVVHIYIIFHSHPPGYRGFFLTNFSQFGPAFSRAFANIYIL